MRKERKEYFDEAFRTPDFSFSRQLRSNRQNYVEDEVVGDYPSGIPVISTVPMEGLGFVDDIHTPIYKGKQIGDSVLVSKKVDPEVHFDQMRPEVVRIFTNQGGEGDKGHSHLPKLLEDAMSGSKQVFIKAKEHRLELIVFSGAVITGVEALRHGRDLRQIGQWILEHNKKDDKKT